MTALFMRCEGFFRNGALALTLSTLAACSTDKREGGSPASGGTGGSGQDGSGGDFEDAGTGGSGGAVADSGGNPVSDGRSDAEIPIEPDAAPPLGCGSSFACASGICEVDGDCYRCISDDECSPGRLCSTGTCMAPCETETDCPNEWLCCDGRCADPARDFDHCAGCGNACSGAEFCGSTGCAPAGIGAVCDAPQITILLDGLPTDDAESERISNTLASACAIPPSITLIDQDQSGLIHTETGRPVAGSGQLVLVLGGTFGQKLVQYLENNGVSRIYNTYDDVAFYQGYSERDVPAPIVNVEQSMITVSHSYFLMESIVDPASHTWVVELYGLNSSGTAAAAWFFENRTLPDLASVTSSHYVYEWTDSVADLLPGDGDTFMQRAP